ncbi:MAG: PIN domain-containing protein [Candidatus Dojkabacteria bacterium]
MTKTHDSQVESILLDSDFILSMMIEVDSNHERAVSLAKQYNSVKYSMLKVVKYEAVTVMSRKFSQEMAVQLVQRLDESEIQLLDIDLKDEREVWSIFTSYVKKNISFIDCANLYFAQKLEYKIASFDVFYPEEYLLN